MTGTTNFGIFTQFIFNFLKNYDEFEISSMYKGTLNRNSFNKGFCSHLKFVLTIILYKLHSRVTRH